MVYLQNLGNINIALTPVNNSDEWVFRKIMEYYDKVMIKLKVLVEK